MKTSKTNDEVYVRRLISESLGNRDEKQDFQQVLSSIKAHGEPVYHRPMNARGSDRMAVIKSLFSKGFSRDYTGDNGGNMYGPGVYNVYNLRSSNEKARGYGIFIVQSYVIDGYKDFLIFNEDIAKKYYGKNYRIEDQVVKLMPPKIANRALAVLRRHSYHDRMNNHATQNTTLTAFLAKEIVDALGPSIANSDVRGIIYSGGHDGCCAFVRNFNAVIPWAYSQDNGRSWEIGVNEEEIKHITDNIDTYFELERFKKDRKNADIDTYAHKSINGFALVLKGGENGQMNYFSVKDKKLISNVWFDLASNFKKDGTANVLYKGVPLTLRYEDGQYIIYDESGFDVCELNELPSIIK